MDNFFTNPAVTLHQMCSEPHNSLHKQGFYDKVLSSFSSTFPTKSNHKTIFFASYSCRLNASDVLTSKAPVYAYSWIWKWFVLNIYILHMWQGHNACVFQQNSALAVTYRLVAQCTLIFPEISKQNIERQKFLCYTPKVNE